MANWDPNTKPLSLQEAIQKAGSPMHLVWKEKAERWTVPIIKPEYVGWREEQAAWRDGVSIADLSHHMSDLFIQGPDTVKLLSDYSANDYKNFAIGQAKQFIPVTKEGNIITDGIVLREGEDKFTLSGVPAAQSWIRYQAETNNYNVTLKTDPDSKFRNGKNPVLFRYQIQGPQALELVEKVFGGPLPKTKFFHTTSVTLDGRSFKALRHGMAGQAGYEFIGDWEHADYIKEKLLKAGEEFGLIHIGGLAYFTNGIESGWIPTPTPAIFTSPELIGYRDSISVFSYEGQKPLHGSYFSENIEDYYCSPYELDYGRSICFNHDFLGRDALEKAKNNVRRKKVTLVLNKDDVDRVFGKNAGFILSYGRYRIESASKLVGMTFYTGYIDPVGTILALSLIDMEYATPGTEVNLVWGEHPGFDADVDFVSKFKIIRAIVQPSPYDQFARTEYRKNN